IRTRGPAPILLNKLSFVFIIPENTAPETLSAMAVGTGPYVVSRWQKEDFIELKRNEHYWGKKPELKNVHYQMNIDAPHALEMVHLGACKLAQCYLKNPAVDPEKFRILRHDNFYVTFLSFDVGRNQ